MIPEVRASFLQRLDPRVKLVTLVGALVVCVSTSADRYSAFAGYFTLAGVALALGHVPPRVIVRRVTVILPFVAACALCLPFLRPGGGSGGYTLGLGGLHVSRSALLVLWNVTAKASFGVLCMTVLTATTPFPAVLRAMGQLRVPRSFVLLANIGYRYLSVLADEASRMRRACAARGYSGRWIWHAPVMGRLVGVLFLRSYERGERIYLAMQSRAFDGQMPSTSASTLCHTDYAFLAATAVILLALRIGVP